MSLFDDPTRPRPEIPDLREVALADQEPVYVEGYFKRRRERKRAAYRAKLPPIAHGRFATAHRCSRGVFPNCTEPVYSSRNCPWCGAPRVPIDGIGYVDV